MKRRGLAQPLGMIHAPDGTQVPVSNPHVVALLERGEREHAELAEYRIAWQSLTTRHNRLQRGWWARLGRWLRVAPPQGRSTDNELRVAAAEVRRAMEREESHGSDEPSRNGSAPV